MPAGTHPVQGFFDGFLAFFGFLFGRRLGQWLRAMSTILRTRTCDLTSTVE